MTPLLLPGVFFLFLFPVSARAEPAAKSPPAVSTASPSAIGADSAKRKRALLLTDLLLEDGRLGDAEAFIAEQSAGDEKKTPWLLRSARLDSARGRPERAMARYQEILASQGDDAETLTQLGLAALSAGEHETALRALDKARSLGADPLIPYYLSEVHFSRGDEASGRTWAKTALEEVPDSKEPRLRRLRLRLRSRLGWEDSIAGEFQKLFQEDPKEPETLFEWSEALLRAGLHAEAAEPLALLLERFPAAQARARKLDAERLRLSGERKAYRESLEQGVRDYPEEASFLLPLGELRLRELRFDEARGLLGRSLSSPGTRRYAGELLGEVSRQGDHHLGPTFRLRRSDNSRVAEYGAEYRGYPRRGLRLEAEGGSAAYELPGRSFRSTVTGLEARAGLERRPWTAGASADLRSGMGRAGAPGLFWKWRPADGWSVAGEAWWRRPWVESGETVAAKADSDEGDLRLEARPLPRLYLGGQLRYNLHRIPGDGRARRTTLIPEAALTLLDRPFFAAAGCRFVAEDARGNDFFFARLPLIRRARTVYATLPFAMRWKEGRARMDGYLFNGHDPGRGREFLRGDLAGLGLNAELDLGGRLRVSAGYDFTRDSEAGLAQGRSHTGRLAMQWHWPGEARGKDEAPSR